MVNGSAHRTTLTMSNATGIDTSPPKCNLCERPYLFVVSVGGRTGSTSVLNMLNAIPHIRLAGENGGQIDLLTSLYEEAASVRPVPSMTSIARIRRPRSSE